MSDAVKRQMISDVPVGVFLSGGVDSALVAVMARDAAVENGVDVPTASTVGLKGTPMLVKLMMQRKLHEY